MQKYKVLFVCLGNICRSPLAEGIMQHLVKEKGVQDRFDLDSAGTSAYHIGEQPDPRSIDVAWNNGIGLSHRARQFVYKDFESFDLIVAMDRANLRDILSLDRLGKYSEKVRLCSEFDVDELYPEEVPDPYYGGDRGFIDVYDQLAVCASQIIATAHPNER